MCGVAGIFYYREPNHPIDVQELDRMTDTLAHRGPDGRGVYVHSYGGLGLGHRRLAIVDVTDAARQPMIAPDGSVLCYNGEIYNHQHWRGLAGLGSVQFRSTSDTETLLHILSRYGTTELAKLSGIFAFAYWDAKRNTLVLARDHLGVKQLYYHDNGERIAFASEVKALLQVRGVPRAVDSAGVNEYLRFHTPLFDNTLFAGIKQVCAGEYIEIGACGAQRHRYWHLVTTASENRDSEANIVTFRRLFEGVVSDQLMSDVPVGVYLSGGIDSTVISAVASRLHDHLPCFGIHYSGQNVVDERPYQEAVAKQLGLRLELATLDGRSFPEDLRRLTYQQDYPVAGTAMFSMNEVSRLAARRVKVCLGGQAADELFGGYARHSVIDPWVTAMSIVRDRLRSGPRSGSGGSRVQGNLRQQLMDRRNLARLAKLAPRWASWPKRYLSLFFNVPTAEWGQTFATSAWYDVAHGQQLFEDHRRCAVGHSPLNQVLMWEVETYLTALFHQDDRMSMANSIESRVPFADPRIARFAFSVPPNQKIRNGASKWLLRRAFDRQIPQAVLERRKIGFDTPVAFWIRNLHRGFVCDLFSSQRARERGWYTDGFLRTMRSGHYDAIHFDRLWKATSLEVWARAMLDSATMP